MWNKKILVLLAFLSMFLSELLSQCSVERNINIIDADTTYISIVVDGLVNDSLQNEGQGLCGVRMDFRHEFLGDISIELISPSGRVVQLVGPAVPVSGNTSFTRWNVFFTPCLADPLPDAGFSSVWDNLQPWGIFGNYTGQYHPFDGCLEDFDAGPVNGTWTLRIIDVSQFGSGRVQGFQLIFCDDEGVDCSECRLDAGYLIAENIEKCESSAAFELQNYTEQFNQFAKDTANYFYKWALFRDTVWVDVLDQGEPIFLQIGENRLCNLQIAKNNVNNLPGLPIDANPLIANDMFLLNNVCAQIGDSCVTITVYPSTDTVFRDTVLCKNQVLNIYNENIAAPGEYIFNIPGIACDTILVLNVLENDLNVAIVSEADSISCSMTVIELSGTNNGTTYGGLTFQWSTLDGSFLPGAVDSIIFVDEPGTYHLIVSDEYCMDTISKQIFLNDDFPDIQILGADTLNCLIDTIELSFQTNAQPGSFVWSSTQPFIQTGNNIKVFFPGEYTLTITSEDGCVVHDNVFIEAVLLVPPASIEGGPLTCGLDTVELSLTHSQPGIYTYQWTGVVPSTNKKQNPLVISEGMKYVDILDVRSGCTLRDSIFIEDERLFPAISIEVESLNCQRDTVIPLLEFDIPVVGYQWMGPGINSIDTNIIITDAGQYSLTVTTAEGCSSKATFFVASDTIQANITLSSDTLSCLNDSVQISFVSDKPIVETIWSSMTSGVVNTEPMPFVFFPDIYTLRARDVDGCVSLQKIQIHGSAELPNMTFEIPSINCLQDTFIIVPQRLDSFHFNWRFPDMSITSDDSLKLTLPGNYLVTVTNIFQPECSEKHILRVRDDRLYPELSLEAGEFTCLKDSATVNVIEISDHTTFTITGPGGIFNNEMNIVLYDLGTYYIESTHQSGCVSIDSFEIVLNDIHPEITVQTPDTINCRNTMVKANFQSTLPNTVFEVYKDNLFFGIGASVDISEPGEYQVLGTAANACRDTQVFVIEFDTVHPDLLVLPFDTLTCIKDSVVLTGVTNFANSEIVWENSQSNPYTVRESGVYTVTNQLLRNGCKTSLEIMVEEDKIYANYDSFSDTITCYNPEIQAGIMEISDFKDVVWLDTNPSIIGQGTITFNTAIPGVYVFIVESSASCFTTDSIVVSSDIGIPSISSISVPAITCANPLSEIILETTSEIETIAWTNPESQTILGNRFETDIPGLYTVRMTGKNGCIKDTTVILEKNVNLPVFTTFTDSLSCKKGKAVIGIQTQDDIIETNWMGPDNFLSNQRNPLITVAGTYKVLVTNVNGCLDSAFVEVKGDYSTPVILVRDTFFIPCDSSLITLLVESADSLVQFYWEREGIPFSDLPKPQTNMQGLYTVWVTGINGCRTIQEFDVIQIHLPVGFTVETDTITCFEPIAVLTANSPHSTAEYTWISPTGQLYEVPIIQSSEAGDFTLIVRDENECLDTLLVTVEADTVKPEIIIDQKGLIACESRKVLLQLPDSLQQFFFTYQWFGNQNQILSDISLPQIQIQEPGTFSISVTNTQNGCSQFMPVEVVETPAPFTTLGLFVVQPPCPEFNFGSASMLALNGLPPYQVTLNSVNYTDRNSFDLLKPGSYSLEVKDSIGCVLDTLFTINAPTLKDFNLPPDTILFLGDSIVFFEDSLGAAWSEYQIAIIEKGDTLCSSDCEFPFIHFPGQTTTYKIVAISNTAPCVFEHTLIVQINEDILSGIPNVIRRKSIDPVNSVFFIPQTRGIEEIVSLEIYDKWANPLFARYNFLSGDIIYGWDGTYQSKPVETGVYVVLCQLRLSNGNLILYQGDLTILD